MNDDGSVNREQSAIAKGGFIATNDNELLLGRNVAWCLKQKGISRAEAARHVGTTVQNVGSLIRGRSKGMKPVNLVRLARFLNHSIEDLVTRDFSRTPTGASGVAEPKPSSFPALRLCREIDRLDRAGELREREVALLDAVLKHIAQD